MNGVRLGANAFIEQLIAGGVTWIFGNPGTTEQTVIDYLQDYPEIELVLALHEGVAISAAEGYARATGRVGVAELHAGPGLGNGIGSLYNAYVSHAPMLVYVGQSEQRSLYQEPVLSADLVGLAAPVTKWAYELRTVEEIPQVVARALKVAATPPCGPVMLSIPLDLTDAPCVAPTVAATAIQAAVRPDPRAIELSVSVVRGAKNPVLLVGDGVAASSALREVSELADLLGAPVFEGSAFETVIEPDLALRAGRLPGEPGAALEALAPYDVAVAIGTRVLAQVFPAPGPPLGKREIVYIGRDEWELAKNQPGALVLADERPATQELHDRLAALAGPQELAGWRLRGTAARAHLKAVRERLLAADHARSAASGIPAARAVIELASAITEEVVVVDESMSGYELVSRHITRHPGRWYRGAGGIGVGLPRAIGIQVARPTAQVLAIVGDGASLYSLTALWTGARHDLPIVWVVLNNASYRTLKQNVLKSRRPGVQHEFVGADLTGPAIDFCSIATGLGVSALRITQAEDIGPAIRKSLASRQPTLVEVLVSGDV